ncbi:hypothetical protein DWY99_10010 [[Clostridium] leptum]|uniref:Uncharacterized protein n=1 Tax=[Clostridium] leptum TaxID=1535 RepID=A0A412AVV8_9FIRM|nr:hypothetical protein DWY99_10010 [[Clostridium] leptum]
MKPGKLSEIFNFPRSSRGATCKGSAPQKPSFQTPVETAPPKKRRPFTNHRAVCGAKVSNQVLFMILTSSMLPDFSDNYGFQDFTAGALSRSVPFYRALTSAPLDSPHSISNSSHSQQNGRASDCDRYPRNIIRFQFWRGHCGSLCCPAQIRRFTGIVMTRWQGPGAA